MKQQLSHKSFQDKPSEGKAQENAQESEYLGIPQKHQTRSHDVYTEDLV